MRTFTLLVLLSMTAIARAEVYVEPATVIVKEDTSVAAGNYTYFELTLDRGVDLSVSLAVTGGIDNTLRHWLLDLANFQKLRARQPFSPVPGAGGDMTGQASYRITIPQTNLYYLVLDNSQAVLAGRQVHAYAYTVAAGETEDSKVTKQFYSALYNDLLKKLFIFEDFDIHVGMCGTANAFSSPDIVMCNELDALLTEREVPGALMFVFLHEAAHSLLNVWDYPLHDNEDAADELATTLLLLSKQQGMALQAAKWWAQDLSADEAVSKLWVDDRHTVSPQRARNIIAWINNEDEVTRRWLHLLIPKMTDEALAAISSEPDPNDPHRAAVDQELIKRRALARGETVLLR
jgi:hypothetical protein